MDRLDHVVLFVRDMDRAVKFYTEVLGLPLNFSGEHFSSVGAGENWIGLHPSEGDGSDIGSGPVVYLRTDDLDGELKRLAEHDIAPKYGPVDVPTGRIATILDSEGNAVGMYQAKQ